MSGYAIFGAAGGGGSQSGQTPFKILEDETFTVQENKQVVFVKRIFIEDGGRLVVGGILVEGR